MTNKDKYLKDNVSVEEFIEALTYELSSWDNKSYSYAMEDMIKKALNKPIIPTLTEDERAILRNIDQSNFKTFGRNAFSLYLGFTHEEEKDCFINYLYHDLFQFIKERRRI